MHIHHNNIHVVKYMYVNETYLFMRSTATPSSLLHDFSKDLTLFPLSLKSGVQDGFCTGKIPSYLIAIVVELY